MSLRRRFVQRGSMSVFLAASMVALLIAIGLGIDGSRALAGSLRVGGEAEMAARTGADALAVPSAYGGTELSLNPSAAVNAATSYVDATGDQLDSVTVTGATVTVTVTTTVPTTILGLIGVASITVTQSGTATAEEGP
jgi:hypothetical protein